MGLTEFASRVADQLRRQLASGRWREGSALPTSRKLCHQLGASLRPVQAAVRQLAREGLLAVRPRQPVMVLPGASDRAREMVEQRTRQDKARRVAILLPEHLMSLGPGAYWYNTWQSLLREAKRRGIQAEVVSWPLLTQIQHAHQIVAQGFKAAIAINVSVARLLALHEMIEMQFPVLVLNRRLSQVHLPSVIRDDYSAIYRIARLFAQSGHRNLCYVTYSYAADQRQLLGGRSGIDGWLAALKDFGLQESSRVSLLLLSHDAGCLRYIMEAKDRPTALMIAVPRPERLFIDGPLANIRIPEELSVAVLNRPSEPPPTPRHPPLTSIVLNMQRAAELAMELVEQLLAGAQDVASIRVPLQVTITESIGPVPRT
ncbi:MAG: GntR family transcriptional regulator [Anaerolineaceae bacterium]|nr:GntR family transcriptional regulator [Anaerolineaceae bacterium]